MSEDNGKDAAGTCDECDRVIFSEDEGWICNLCPDCFQQWREECYDALLQSRSDARPQA